MTKHSKNQTTRPFLTADERKKWSGGDFGSMSSKVGGDSQLRWDQCRLCLGTLVKPVASPVSGALFCRPCILENLLAQAHYKEERIAEWESGVAAGTALASQKEVEGEVAKMAQFMESESAAVVRSSTGSGSGGGSGSGSGSGSGAFGGRHQGSSKIDERDEQEKREAVAKASPWAPQHAPSHSSGSGSGSGSAGGANPRPDALTRDPVSGDPLRLKMLIEVNLTLSKGVVEEEEGEDGEGGGGGGGGAASAASKAGTSAPTVGDTSRFSCPSCDKPFVFQKTYLLVPCGHVLCASCITTVIAKTKECCVCAKGPLKKPDFLHVQREVGSSFVGKEGTVAEAKVFRPSVQA